MYFKSLSNFFSAQEKDNKYNYFALAIASVLGHIFFHIQWTYIDPQPYEESNLRIIGVVGSIILLWAILSNSFSKKLIDIYWFFLALYNLPFFFTVSLIMNDFSDIWLVAYPPMIFIVIMFFSGFILPFLVLITGIVFAAIFCSLLNANKALFDQDILRHIPIIIFTICSAHVFTISNNLGFSLAREVKFSSIKKRLISLAGSIAHELRNPLSAIRSSASIIDINPKNADVNELNKMSKEQLVKLLSNDTKEILEHKSHLNKSVNLANAIIDMTLADLSGKKISESDFTYINSSKIINEAIDLYAFKSVSERERVKINSDIKNINDSKNNSIFIFKGIETALYYIFFNLIKNALYYVQDRPDLAITISSSNALGKGILYKAKNNINISNHLKLKPEINYNIIHIHDTGPGIAPDIIHNLFGSFVTSGKEEGTGLGLEFCKRTMIDFGGDINCESELGSWTRFNLYFPQLSDDELVKAKKYFKNLGLDQEKLNNSGSNNINIHKAQNNVINNTNKLSQKILIADDQAINLLISKKLIHKLLPNAIIDLAYDGKEALELVKKNISEDKESLSAKYSLIITDIQMPAMDGFELAKAIRGLDKYTPIAAYTSRTSYKIKQEALDIGIDDYIIKPIPNNGLLKAIYKWLINKHNYNYDIEKIKDRFSGLKILIADDEMINLMVMKKFLSKYNIMVETASDGAELVDKYKDQFLQEDLRRFIDDDNYDYAYPSLTNKYDVIIADINMPNKKGDQAVKEIRNFELIYNISHKAIIIANSGDSAEQKIKSMLKSGMDDYFIKGQDNKHLLQIIYFWLSYNNNKKDSSYLDIDNKSYMEEEDEDEDLKVQIFNDKLTKEDLLEFRDLFIKSSKDLLKKIKKAQKNKDIEDVAFQSHALKGISGNVGAEKLFIYISMINNYAKKDKWPEEEGWLEKLQDIIDESFKALKEI